MCGERPLPLYQVVQCPQLNLEPFDGEPRDDPDDQPEEGDDGADVEEDGPEPLVAQISDDEACGLAADRASRGSRADPCIRVPSMSSPSSPTLAGPTCCERKVPPGHRTRAIASHQVTTG